MTLTSSQKAQIAAEYGRDKNDTGASEVQVALLTARIQYLTDHLKTFTKDKHAQYGLLKLVSKRRRLLDYLKREAVERYRALIKRLKLRR